MWNPYSEASLNWHAVQVKPKHEKVVAETLAHKGFEQFAPLYPSRRRWSDRVKTVELPLFPGYVFCRFQRPERTAVLTTPSIVSIVSFGAHPAIVEDAEIEAIQKAVRSNRPLRPWPNLPLGTTVRVTQGVLEGVTGTLVCERGHFRVVLSVSLVNSSVAVDVDRIDIEPIASD